MEHSMGGCQNQRNFSKPSPLHSQGLKFITAFTFVFRKHIRRVVTGCSTVHKRKHPPSKQSAPEYATQRKRWRHYDWAICILQCNIMFSQGLNWQEYLTQGSQLLTNEIMNNDLSVTTSRAQTMLAYRVQFANLAQWVVCNCSCTSCFRVTRLWAEQSGVRFLSSERNFPLVHTDKTCSGAYPGRWRWPERDANHSPPSCAQVKNYWS